MGRLSRLTDKPPDQDHLREEAMSSWRVVSLHAGIPRHRAVDRMPARQDVPVRAYSAARGSRGGLHLCDAGGSAIKRPTGLPCVERNARAARTPRAAWAVRTRQQSVVDSVRRCLVRPRVEQRLAETRTVAP